MGWRLVVGACFEVGLGNSRVAIGALGCCVLSVRFWRVFFEAVLCSVFSLIMYMHMCIYYIWATISRVGGVKLSFVLKLRCCFA